jgi:hypothetical protein
VTPDVREESEIAELIFNKALPANIKNISKEKIFDEATYVMNYKNMLNKYKGRSFYNMTGFGDISILALLATLKRTFQAKPQKLFFEAENELVVITEDGALIQKIEKEFNQLEKNQNWKVKIFENKSVL